MKGGPGGLKRVSLESKVGAGTGTEIEEVAVAATLGVGTQGWLHQVLHGLGQQRAQVVVTADWGWVLALRQLGLSRVNVLNKTSQLWKTVLKDFLYPHVGGLEEVEHLDSSAVAFGHVASVEEWNVIAPIFVNHESVVIVSFPQHLKRQLLMSKMRSIRSPGRRPSKILVSHQHIGGLTDVAVVIACWDFRELERPLDLLFPIDKTPRSGERFLEPSTRLLEWRRPKSELIDDLRSQVKGEGVWDPRSGPIHVKSEAGVCLPDWVLAPTVFMGGKKILRRLKTKEKGQILDIREDWGLFGSALIWDTCQQADRHPLPIRIPTTVLTKNLSNLWPGLAVGETTLAVGSEETSVLQSVEKPETTQLLPTWDAESVGFLRGTTVGTLTEAPETLNVPVACKPDAAGIDSSLWSVGGDSSQAEAARQVLRKTFHTIWALRLIREAYRWLLTDKRRALAPSDGSREEISRLLREHRANREAIFDCLTRCCASTWFEWKDGSRLLFWRWPEEWREEARDGGFVYRIRPSAYKPNARKVDMTPDERRQLVEKLRKYILERRYISNIPQGEVRVACVYFAVAKGENDIRVVWSETETGVNDDVYAPNFMLPTMGTLTRRLPNGARMGDFDVGEMFNNFMMYPRERKYHCVEYPEELQEEAGSRFGCWNRLLFGFRPSPYLAVRMMTRCMELSMGDRSDPKNPFWFVRVKLNLPMDPVYDPTQPRVQVLDGNGNPAAGVVPYIDDGRSYAGSLPLLESATRYLVSRMEYLGVQDAKRKRRKGGQRTGAWAGGVVFTDKGVTRVFLSQTRWDKMRKHIAWFLRLSESMGVFPLKEFLRARGFLVYASMTYEFIQPFMKSIHLTADAWRLNRDKEGWKRTAGNKNLWDHEIEESEDDDEYGAGELDEAIELEALQQWQCGDDDEQLDEIAVPQSSDRTAPPQLTAVPSLLGQLQDLARLTNSLTPLMIPVRANRSINLVYGFGDASGEGFGSAARVFAPGGTTDPSTQPVRTRRGFWCTAISEEASNYREMRNILEMLVDLNAITTLSGAEVFLFMDNEVTERVYYRGSSSNKMLYGLMFDMRKLSLDYGFKLYVVHIAGTRMIGQGTDGLSRGEFQLGSLTDPVAQIVPLHLSPTDRSPALLEWILSWATLRSGKSMHLASPTDWIHNAHQPGFNIWSLPPAAALYALEELGQAKVKRGGQVGAVILIPKLMKPEWFRRFHRVVDVFFEVKPNCPWWPKEMHELLLIGFVFPLLRCDPWRWKEAAWMVAMGRTLSTLHKNDIICQNEDTDGKRLLVSGDESRFVSARPGDHLVCPFECEWCQFEKLKNRAAQEDHEPDVYLLAFMRRAHLDAFWAREPRTVAGNLREALRNVAIAEEFGFDAFPPLGPWPRRYDHGMGNAVTVLRNTLSKGSKPGTTKKFSAARKARTPFSNFWAACPDGAKNAQVWRSEKKRTVTTSCLTDSEWYERFMKGLSYRMGQVVRQDAAISIESMLVLMEIFEEDWAALSETSQTNAQELRKVTEAATYSILTYCASLRGFETPKILLSYLRDFIKETPQGNVAPHIGLPMAGRFKQRGNSEQKLLLFVAAVTASGLQPLKWTRRLIDLLQTMGVTQGWLFQDSQGRQLRMSHFEEPVLDRIAVVQVRRPDLIQPKIDVYEDYGLARSFRRGATTRAQNSGVAGPDVDYINRWSTALDGPQPYFLGNMRVHYSDQTQMVETFLRFSLAL